MTKGSPRHEEGEKDLGDKKDNEVSTLRSVDDGAWVRDLGLTLSPGSQLQEDAHYESKYDAESPSISGNTSCGRSPPWRSCKPGICAAGNNTMETENQDEPIGSISGSCECTQSPSYDSGLDSTKMDAGSMHNVQPYGAMVEHHAPGAQADRRTKQLLSREQALHRHHHQVVEYEKHVQAQARNHAVVNAELHHENQALRHHVAQLKSQFNTVMQAQAQAHQHDDIIDQLRGENQALHIQIAQLKNELEVNTRDYHHSYRQLQHQSENEKRDLHCRQAALEAEINQYKSSATMFSGMSAIDAQLNVMKLRQDLAQSVKARQHIIKTADEAIKRNIARCKATVNQAKDTIARLTQERNVLDATNHSLIDMLPIADAKMKETSTRHLLESAVVGSSRATSPMMPRRHAGNHMTSTKDLLASFRPNQPRPAQHPVTIDLTGEYPSPAETPAICNMPTTYTGVVSPPVASSFNDAVQTYTDEAQAQLAPDFNMYGLFPGAPQLSDPRLGYDFLTTYTNSAQSSSSPIFDSALPACTSVAAYPVAPDESDLLESNSNSAPFSMSPPLNITPQSHAEVAASSIAPTANDTAEAYTAAPQTPILFVRANPIDPSTQVTVSPDPARTQTPFSAYVTGLLDNEAKRLAERERAEAEAVAEAEAAWVSRGFSGYLNGSLEQTRDAYGDNVQAYRSWLLDNHEKNKRKAQRERAAVEAKELAQFEEGHAESESEDVGETVANEG